MNGDGKFDKGRFTTIPETRNIKLPIGGKIRLGIKVKNEKGIEHPKEVDFFVCPKEVRDVYGEEPTELTVFFPVADREKVFPQSYEKYGGNEALLCQGDGETSAQRLNLENGRWEEVKCPCEHYNKKYDKRTKIGGCVKQGYLKFMIPSVSIGTFYQCRIGGTVSIEECNSAFELADKTTGGCWAMIPFRMKRVPKKLKIPGTANMKNHWVVTLEIAASTEEIRRVISGEILYLGQQRNKKYELETTRPAEGKEDETGREEESDEDEKGRQAGLQEKETEENKQQNENEAKLKEETEEGKHNIRTPEQIKKKLEARNAILDEVVKVAKEHGVNNWRGIMDIGERHNVFAKGFVASQVKTFVVDHPDKCEELKEAIRRDEEITDEDIPGKLELKEGHTGLLEEEEEAGSSPDNAHPYKGKKKALKKVSKAEDFVNDDDYIAPEDLPE